ncbi:hypothetical protein [Nocardia sp. NPDC055049]
MRPAVSGWFGGLLKLRQRVPALGYLVAEESGPRRKWDEQLIRSTGAKLGYSVMKTMVTSHGAGDPADQVVDPIDQLITLIRATGAEAVVVPSFAHFFGGVVPLRLVRAADVIPVDNPSAARSRWEVLAVIDDSSERN